MEAAAPVEKKKSPLVKLEDDMDLDSENEGTSALNVLATIATVKIEPIVIEDAPATHKKKLYDSSSCEESESSSESGQKQNPKTKKALSPFEYGGGSSEESESSEEDQLIQPEDEAPHASASLSETRIHKSSSAAAALCKKCGIPDWTLWPALAKLEPRPKSEQIQVHQFESLKAVLYFVRGKPCRNCDLCCFGPCMKCKQCEKNRTKRPGSKRARCERLKCVEHPEIGHSAAEKNELAARYKNEMETLAAGILRQQEVLIGRGATMASAHKCKFLVNLIARYFHTCAFRAAVSSKFCNSIIDQRSSGPLTILNGLVAQRDILTNDPKPYDWTNRRTEVRHVEQLILDTLDYYKPELAPAGKQVLLEVLINYDRANWQPWCDQEVQREIQQQEDKKRYKEEESIVHT
jgi:hypothetical protein